MGHYLAEFGQPVRGRVPGQRLTGRVTSMCRTRDAWELCSPETRSYDEVLLASGHASDWPGALRHGWASPLPLVPGVFPVAELRDSVPDRDGVVVVRGAALTALDAVLALTQERTHPSRVVLASRTGRLMTPKPEPHVLAAVPELDSLLEEGGRLLSDLDTPVEGVLRDVCPGALQPDPSRTRQSLSDPAPSTTRWSR